MAEPLPIAGSKREYPSPVKFLEMAQQHSGVHVDVEKPFWWDMPVWVATGKIDSMGLANNHQHRDGMLDNEAWGKPRETALFLRRKATAAGRSIFTISCSIAACGFRLRPAARRACCRIRSATTASMSTAARS